MEEDKDMSDAVEAARRRKEPFDSHVEDVHYLVASVWAPSISVLFPRENDGITLEKEEPY